MSKINLPTLAYNAARAKARLERQTDKLRKLTDQLIARVGTGGQTIQTNLGQVIITEETVDRPGQGFFVLFNEEKFLALEPKLQLQLTELGVVHTQKRVIRGQAPKVQFRLVK